jgi:hypothetical protein
VVAGMCWLRDRFASSDVEHIQVNGTIHRQTSLKRVSKLAVILSIAMVAEVQMDGVFRGTHG